MSINYNTSEYDKKFNDWLKEENRKQAIEHAKALKQFCFETYCRDCPFGKKADFGKDRFFCKIADYAETPCGWELEEE